MWISEYEITIYHIARIVGKIALLKHGYNFRLIYPGFYKRDSPVHVHSKRTQLGILVPPTHVPPSLAIDDTCVYTGQPVVSYPDPDSHSCGWLHHRSRSGDVIHPQLWESGSGYETRQPHRN